MTVSDSNFKQHLSKDTASRSRGAISPELSQKFVPLKKRGRRESRVPDAPAASRAKINKAHERSHR
jgi:hypothetical protein